MREVSFWIVLSRSQCVCCPFRGNLQLKRLLAAAGGRWIYHKISVPWKITKVARRALGGRWSPEVISYSHKFYPHWWSVLRAPRRCLARLALAAFTSECLSRAKSDKTRCFTVKQNLLSSILTLNPSSHWRKLARVLARRAVTRKSRI